ncbi:hypothetical protein D0469_02430 [Peribacillus saganii]|uniref:Uncharacterized protein n=1 Tax=Peribacillus saganii TaxID=2303992 RepID=A0A372LTX0_9BACI|nr:hypothetical protein [Peribacillus saganii]RFU71250.1 hypothetical protein D0469_02430 [Peribacillus saganii]
MIRLTTKEELMNLKKGDILLVQWKRNAPEYKQNGEITHHNVHRITRFNEVILDENQNTYFNIGLYIAGTSFVKEVCLIEP